MPSTSLSKKVPALSRGDWFSRHPGVSSFFLDVTGMAQFVVRFFKELFKPPLEINETMKQCYIVGNKSIGVVSIAGFIMGVVLVLQSRPSLVQFGAGSYLPAVVAVSIVREIGPLVTALVCAGKISSGISAELGSMRVSEQIDAMEVSGTNPFKYLVVTRVIAASLMIPLLVIYADTISLTGSFLGANTSGHISLSLYVNQVFEVLEFSDVLPSIIKTLFFGFVIGLTGSYMGYNSDNGTEGVGRATNSSVVVSLLLVIVVDLVAVQITSLFTGTTY